MELNEIKGLAINYYFVLKTMVGDTRTDGCFTVDKELYSYQQMLEVKRKLLEDSGSKGVEPEDCYFETLVELSRIGHG